MKTSGGLSLGVADLLRRPGNHREEHLEAVLGGLQVVGSKVPEGAPIEIDVRLESVNDAVVVKGSVQAPWTGECRRCLRPIESRLRVDVYEVFEDEPVDGETRKLEIDRIDLEPMAREAVLLELPLAPLCQEDCAGLCPECGADRNAGDCGHVMATGDNRWAALDELRFDD